jgi:hypothetical protein
VLQGGGLGQSSSEGRRQLGDVGGDVVGLASAQGGAQSTLARAGVVGRAAFFGRKRDRDRSRVFSCGDANVHG